MAHELCTTFPQAVFSFCWHALTALPAADVGCMRFSFLKQLWRMLFYGLCSFLKLWKYALFSCNFQRLCKNTFRSSASFENCMRMGLLSQIVVCWWILTHHPKHCGISPLARVITAIQYEYGLVYLRDWEYSHIHALVLIYCETVHTVNSVNIFLNIVLAISRGRGNLEHLNMWLL